MPTKQSWEGAKKHAQGAESTSQFSRVATPKTPSYPVGLGLNLGSGAEKERKGGHGELAKSRTSPFWHDGGVPISSTEPLMQQAFSTPHRAATGSAGGNEADDDTQSFVSNPFPTASPPGITVTQPSLPSEDDENVLPCLPDLNLLTVPTPGVLSDDSDISEHAEAEQRDADEKVPCVIQAPHPKSFNRAILDGTITFRGAFAGAYPTIKSLNPSHFQMPFGVSPSIHYTY